MWQRRTGRACNRRRTDIKNTQYFGRWQQIEQRYCLRIAYDGTDYSGFQTQKNARTIQDEIEQALFKIYKNRVKINYSGRTDKGVHAFSQYIDFMAENNLSPFQLKLALNANTTYNISANQCFIVNLDFNSRFCARYREYTYFIHNRGEIDPFTHRYSWHIPYFLNVEKMQDIKHYFIGEQDYKYLANRSDADNFVRKVHFLRIKRFRHFIIINIRANGFLRGMVRNIVGLLVAYAKNGLKITDIKDIINGERVSNFKAPARGLFLSNVNYAF